MASDFEKKTRTVFHQIHSAIIEDPAQDKRTYLTNSGAYMGLEPGFFRGKLCLEAGCGSIAPGAQDMLSDGAAKVYALDLDESIFEIAPKYLAAYEGRYELKVGSVLALPFPDDHFDFAMCSGVLQHTADPLLGLREVCRVTQPGGSIFIHVQGAGGLMKAITAVAHEMYEADPAFRQFIDELTPDKIQTLVAWLSEELKKHGDDFASKSIAAILPLLDQDMILTIFDRVKAPAYNNVAEADFLAVLDEYGFHDRRRLTKFHQFNNVRRYLAPLYTNYHSELSRFLYGDGMLEYFATKQG